MSMVFMAKSVCIICGQEKDGIEVENDFVLESIRWFKRNVTKNEKGNRLVVCKDCYAKYRDARKKYESRVKTYLVLGFLFLIFTVLVSSDKLFALGVSILLIIFLYLLSLLSYMPKLKIKVEKAK